MKIVNCEEVISFWQRGIRLKQDLGFLRVLVIESCPNFTSMEADEGDGQRELWIPSGLRCLRLNGCECLVELPRALFINIKGCDALESLPQAWIWNHILKLCLTSRSGKTGSFLWKNTPNIKSGYKGKQNSSEKVSG
ncbi:hypothetical protein Pint_23906 [Pistacia integerrima]|uniref:Uncharacterized protein n=1 Tax=Pistacia integerrima TaxID=434235 RepID=A0ACC0YNQ0_9ROSI|nr:hypothetical protein Pint_23906 [Pistacia integerrima]